MVQYLRGTFSDWRPLSDDETTASSQDWMTASVEMQSEDDLCNMTEHLNQNWNHRRRRRYRLVGSDWRPLSDDETTASSQDWMIASVEYCYSLSTERTANGSLKGKTPTETSTVGIPVLQTWYLFPPELLTCVHVPFYSSHHSLEVYAGWVTRYSCQWVAHLFQPTAMTSAGIQGPSSTDVTSLSGHTIMIDYYLHIIKTTIISLSWLLLNWHIHWQLPWVNITLHVSLRTPLEIVEFIFTGWML